MIPPSINNLQSLIKSLALPTAWIVAQMVASFQQARPTRTKRTSCPFQTPFYGRWRKKIKKKARKSFSHLFGHDSSASLNWHHLLDQYGEIYSLSLSRKRSTVPQTGFANTDASATIQKKTKSHATAAPRLWGLKHSKLPCQLHLEVVLPELLERPPGKAVVETGSSSQGYLTSTNHG